MSPQARGKLPPELGRLTRKDMEAVIYQANLGRENEKIAQLYFVDKLPQVDVATELSSRLAPFLPRAVSSGRQRTDTLSRGLGLEAELAFRQFQYNLS